MQPSPPPPPQASPSRFSTLPPGWTTATDHSDGRIFYLEIATGRTCWTHPLAGGESWNDYRNMNGSDSDKVHWMDTPLNATRRPDTSQCYSLVSCLLFPPLGIIALIHSYLTDRAWKQGRYSDAYGHAREAPQYAGLAVCVGIAFWIWYLFIRGDGVDWFQGWDFNFGE